MRLINYFREFSDIYFEEILGLELDYSKVISRPYFKSKRTCNNERVCFFMNKMEKYLVERNEGFYSF